MDQRQLFLHHLAQTSPAPLALEIVKAEGCILTDRSGKEYIDLIGGISVANIGHRHPEVVSAISLQMEAYLHIMVYGEFIQSPQVQYATFLAQHLPKKLEAVYFTNSGAEAVEGAMKLSKKATGRSGMIAYVNSYHGSTQGALSLIGDEYWRNAYRPLLPGITHARFNSFEDLLLIDETTASVFAETVQAEAGIIRPDTAWIKALRYRCDEVGALLVLDEIQCGFGRTGSLWGFDSYQIEPDILLLGKALGGGLPLGAFISSKKLMDQLSENPVLGHITTFGGHPLSCVAGMKAMEVLLEGDLISSSLEKEEYLRSKLKHPAIKEVRSAGLWMAVEFKDAEACRTVIEHCIKNGILTDWFLFAPACLRISPPLSITYEQMDRAVETILAGI